MTCCWRMLLINGTTCLLTVTVLDNTQLETFSHSLARTTTKYDGAQLTRSLLDHRRQWQLIVSRASLLSCNANDGGTHPHYHNFSRWQRLPATNRNNRQPWTSKTVTNFMTENVTSSQLLYSNLDLLLPFDSIDIQLFTQSCDVVGYRRDVLDMCQPSNKHVRNKHVCFLAFPSLWSWKFVGFLTSTDKLIMLPFWFCFRRSFPAVRFVASELQ